MEETNSTEAKEPPSNVMSAILPGGDSLASFHLFLPKVTASPLLLSLPLWLLPYIPLLRVSPFHPSLTGNEVFSQFS